MIHNMKYITKRISILLVFILVFAGLFGCVSTLPADVPGSAPGGGVSSPSVAGPTPQSTAGNAEDVRLPTSGEAAYTIMVYIDGANLESESGLASLDLEEMVIGLQTQPAINVIAQTGGARTWHNPVIPNNAIGRYRVTGNGLEELETLPQQDMTEPATLAQFLSYGYQNFPARRYALVMWNHGAGPLYGYGMDENYDENSIMTLNDMVAALKASPVATTPMEFIGFDSCLMASIEIASLLSPFGRYLIASQELEPGLGWDYRAWLASLAASPDMDGRALGQVITDSFIQYYDDNGMNDAALALSVVDMSKIQPLVRALEAFAASAGSATQPGFQQLARLRSNIKEFAGGPRVDQNQYGLIDLGDLAQQISATNPAEGAALTRALQQAVLYNKKNATVEVANGLSVYFPNSDNGYLKEDMALYKSTGFSPTYVGYLEGFVANLGGSPITPMNNLQRMSPALGTAGQPDDARYRITLSQQQAANVSDAYFVVWQRQANDSYRQIYQDSNVQVDPATGRVLSGFDGTITTINGEAACLYESDRGEKYVRYQVPAIMNGTEVNMQLLYDDAKQETRLVGAIPVYPKTHLAARELWQVKEGDKLALSYYTQTLDEVGGSDGEGAKDTPRLRGGDELTTGQALNIKTENLPAGNYLYGFVVVDLQGNLYETGYTEMKN